jgi:arginase
MKIRLIDVPMDFGASRRGVNIGPTALRLAGLKECLGSLGHMLAEEATQMAIPIAESADVVDEKKKYWPVIKDVCLDLFGRMNLAFEAGDFPLIMGGDHSLAIGSLGAVASYCRRKNKTPAVFWIDAHADFNTVATSPSGNVHGMPVASACGLCPDLDLGKEKLDPKNVYMIGLRQIDEGEKDNLKRAGVNCWTMADIDRAGIDGVMDEALLLAKKNSDFLHVSLDADALDPVAAPGVGTAVEGGLTYREAHYAMESLFRSGLVGSAEVVEINPLLDVRNQTAQSCVKLLASLFGDSIL